MHERYIDDVIKQIWSDEYKLALWQKVELAIISALSSKGHPSEIPNKITSILQSNPIDIEWWKTKDKEIHHDLNAFVLERLRYLPPELQQYFHKKVTSYDIEEPAFAIMMAESLKVVKTYLEQFEEVLKSQAKRYRYTIMNARTHGQEAELQSLGKRFLSWYQDVQISKDMLDKAHELLHFSKISGAIGNYSGIDPDIEEKSLKLLGLKPFYGATQIMPREIYLPLASTLVGLAGTLNKIALTIRLGARSGNPIYQEPFRKKQTGSSTMPHKKNTIRTEQMEGMFRMAQSYLSMITANIQTWEERAIEQSCVERVAWPDLFHVVCHMLKVMTRVIKNLKVYPDNMIREIVASKGVYASSAAKEFLVQYGLSVNLTREECYRIVQLAAFNALYDSPSTKVPTSLSEADKILSLAMENKKTKETATIEDIIANGLLTKSEAIDIGEEKIAEWNKKLKKLFSNNNLRNKWSKIFKPSYLLQNEQSLFEQIL